MARTVKSLKARIREAGIMHSDRMVSHADGTFTFKRGYFYRHGMDEEKFTSALMRDLAKAGFSATLVENGDRWAPWPKDSFSGRAFQVTDMVQATADATGKMIDLIGALGEALRK